MALVVATGNCLRMLLLFCSTCKRLLSCSAGGSLETVTILRPGDFVIWGEFDPVCDTDGLAAADLTRGERALWAGQWLCSCAFAEEMGVKLRGFGATAGGGPAPLRALVTRAVTAWGEGILTCGVPGEGALMGLLRTCELPSPAPVLAEVTWACKVAAACLTCARAAASCAEVRGEPCALVRGEEKLGPGDPMERVGVEAKEGEG